MSHQAFSKRRSSFSFLKHIITFLIFTTLLAQIFQGDFIILDYYTNQKSFAALCVNKDKPQMHCNGRCQMYKKIQQVHKENANTPNPQETLKLKSLYIVRLIAYISIGSPFHQKR